MNKLFSLTCFALIAFAVAAPIDSGYSYQQPSSFNQVSQQQFGYPVQSFLPSAPQLTGAATHIISSQHIHQPQQQTIVSKDFYIHSSPEETEEINIDQGVDVVPNRKNYRIVFIRAPSHNIKFNVESLKRHQAANEEKTVIYVLAKKPDVTTIQSQFSELQTEQKLHKPEVHFIKYKTQEEANRAQQEIQAQFEALGGSTQVSDEGFAPVTSVIGSLGGGSVNGGSFSSGSNFVQSASNNQQHFVQQTIQGNQGAASSVSLGITAPSIKYLPAKKK